MSCGFHAFFRQCDNLRALLRRVDPRLDGLVPIPDYPVRRADGTGDSYAGLPRTAPLNPLGSALRSPNFGLHGLRRANVRDLEGMGVRVDTGSPAGASILAGQRTQLTPSHG